MKARVLYPHEVGPPSDQAAIEAWQKEKVDYARGVPGAKRYPLGWRDRGTIVDHPDCWINCRMGQMEPADDECLEAVKRALKADGVTWTEELQAQAYESYAAMTEGRLTGDPNIDRETEDEDE